MSVNTTEHFTAIGADSPRKLRFDVGAEKVQVKQLVRPKSPDQIMQVQRLLDGFIHCFYNY